MKKGFTEIVYILDRSGSMGGLEADTIGGFNAMIKKEKKTGEEALVSTLLFDDVCEVLHDRVRIEEIEELTEKEYYVRGATALLDTIGKAVHHIGTIHKYIRKGDRPKKTLFVIMTDGMENASREYSYSKIQEMIKRQREKYGWEFLFIGANIDALEEAEKVGIRRGRAVNYVCDERGTAKVYEGIAKAVCSVMKAPTLEAMQKNLDESGWEREIQMDYQKRGRQKRR